MHLSIQAFKRKWKIKNKKINSAKRVSVMSRYKVDIKFKKLFFYIDSFNFEM